MNTDIEGKRKMKKILHMTPMDVRSGVYKYIFENLQYIHREKYEFGFLTRAGEQLYKSHEYAKYKFNIHPFFSTQRGDPNGLKREIRRVLEEYDIIHLHTSSWRGFMIEQQAMEIGMEKVIVHSHSTGIDITDSVERNKQIREHISYREKFSTEYATDFCACSKAAAEWLFGESVSPELIRIMPNAINTRRFQYNRNSRKAIRKALHIDDKFVIGHVGRYSYTKNVCFLFRCLAEAIKIHDDIVMICIGQGELKNEYERVVKQLNIKENVILLEWQDDIDKYYQAFDLFCLPSVFEGYPLSVVEAQASGLPCLVSSNVTNEVKLTSLVDFCTLKEQIWRDSILSAYDKGIKERRGYDKIVAEKGYDLHCSAKRLEDLYDES